MTDQLIRLWPEHIFLELVSNNDEFRSLQTNEARLRFAVKYLRKINPEEYFVKFEAKCSTTSNIFRQDGNVLLTKKHDLHAAITTYTKSIAYAPPNSEELSLGYANRSAALFQGKLYEDCLLDIDRALKLNYPEKLKSKLYFRKARCIKALNSNQQDVNKALKDAENYLDKMNTKDNLVMQKLLKDPKQMILPPPFIKWNSEKFMPKLKEENKKITGTSSAVELKYSKEFGRHIVAARDIKPGELLALHKAYVNCVDQEKKYELCAHCGDQVWSAVPCHNCVHVIYCSEYCSQVALFQYHDIECPVIAPLIATKLENNILLPLKITAKAFKEFNNLSELKLKLQAIDSRTDPLERCFVDGVLDSDKYTGVYVLEKNDSNASSKHMLSWLITTITITNLLANTTNVFSTNKKDVILPKDNDDDWFFLAGIIMTNCQISFFNTRYVSVYESDISRIEHQSAILPAVSFYNHCCYVKVGHCMFKNKMALFSLFSVKKGEQIFDNYGAIVWDMSKKERQNKLKFYSFTCNCVACREDWPSGYDWFSPTVSKDFHGHELQCMAFTNSYEKLNQIQNLVKSCKDVTKFPDIMNNIHELSVVMENLRSKDKLIFCVANLLIDYYFIIGRHHILSK